MEYPAPDEVVIATAREKHDATQARVEATRGTIAELERILAEHKRRRKAALDAAAKGEPISPQQLAEIEAGTASTETSLAHQNEILTRQLQHAQRSAEEWRMSHGLAHRPRVVAALAEMHRAGQAAQAAQTALHEAAAADAAARRVITQAFAAGFPVPHAIKAGAGIQPGKEGLPVDTRAPALHRTWGKLAEEAIGPLPKATTPTRQPGLFVCNQSFGIWNNGGTLEIKAGRPIWLDASAQVAIEAMGHVLISLPSEAPR